MTTKLRPAIIAGFVIGNINFLKILSDATPKVLADSINRLPEINNDARTLK